MSTLTLKVDKFESETLAGELAKALAGKVGGGDVSSAEVQGDLDKMNALIEQAVGLAGRHKLAGAGSIRLDVGERPNVALATDSSTAIGQNIDPAALQKVQDARAAKAKAARKLVVVPTPKPASPGGFKGAAPASSPAGGPAAGPAAKPSATKTTPVVPAAPPSGAGKGSAKPGKAAPPPPGQRQTTPPPGRR